MSLPAPFYRYQGEIEAELKLVVHESPLLLYRMIRYHLGWEDEQGQCQQTSSGKLIRPTLCLLACEAVKGDWHAALPAAAAIELLHNFSLIHDDIEDRSWQRRHRPTIWKLWGEAQGINVGDAMHALAQLSLLRLAEKGVSQEKIVLASQLMNQTCLELCEGQYLDIEYQGCLQLNIDDYLKMANKKTAQLFECSFHLGALLGTDNQTLISHLCSFGKRIGLAYQMRNDYLDIWGEGSSFSDIKQKKGTLPLIYALEKAKGEEKKNLQGIYSKDEVSDEDVAMVLRIWDNLGVRDYVEQMIEQYYHQALQELESARLPSSAHQELAEIASFLLRINSFMVDRK